MGALAAAMVSVLVGLPAHAGAPAPGALPVGAPVQALDRELGIAEVRLPRAGLAAALRHLRAAPGTRYATVEGGGHPASNCTLGPASSGLPSTWWRPVVDLPAKARANGFTVAVVDSGADVERLGSHQLPIFGRDFTGGSGDWTVDPLGHGTAVAGLIAANRPDVQASGIAPSADLVIARVAVPGACSGGRFVSATVRALQWVRTQAVQIVNVSASYTPTQALRDEFRALQLRGALVVAAAGNADEGDTASGYPAALPHVVGVAALSGPGAVDPQSVRGRQVDLAAPASGLGIVASSARQADPTTISSGGTSFAAPLVSGAAALVLAAHPTWTADRVAAALRGGARHLGAGQPNPATGYGVLDVARSLSIHPASDRLEPNDWVAAARVQPALPAPGALSASLAPVDDPIDAYRVHLRARERLRLHWSSSLAGLQVAVLRPGAAVDALDGGVRAASRKAMAQARGSSGTLGARAGGAGDYLVVVGGERARGTYRLSLGG